MYQQMKNMWCAEAPDQQTLRYVRNTVSNAGLKTLHLPGLAVDDSHKILTDVMLTPVEMGGAGMEDPARRLVQDDATNILTGLAHPSEVVRETFHTVLAESSDFQVSDGKCSRIDFCRNTAEIQLHLGQQHNDAMITYDTFKDHCIDKSRTLLRC